MVTNQLKYIAAALIGAAFTLSGLPQTAEAKTRQAKRPASRKPVSQTPSENWTVLAKQVGQSEDAKVIAEAVRKLKKKPSLSHDLRVALRTKDRPLALEVISALKISGLIPDLIKLAPSDPDGFLVIALNSMVTNQNQNLILGTYLDTLSPRHVKAVSSGATVAMLEALGRIGERIPSSTASNLVQAKSPEVRGAILYYARMMALRHRNTDYTDVVDASLQAREYQLRLQAVSIASEILGASKKKNLRVADFDRHDLVQTCEQETEAAVKETCHSLISVDVEVAGR